MEAVKHEIWHKGNLGNEDDVRTMNTLIAGRRRAIPLSAMKMHRNIIVCCNRLQCWISYFLQELIRRWDTRT